MVHNNHYPVSGSGASKAFTPGIPYTPWVLPHLGGSIRSPKPQDRSLSVREVARKDAHFGALDQPKEVGPRRCQWHGSMVVALWLPRVWCKNINDGPQGLSKSQIFEGMDLCGFEVYIYIMRWYEMFNTTPEFGRTSGFLDWKQFSWHSKSLKWWMLSFVCVYIIIYIHIFGGTILWMKFWMLDVFLMLMLLDHDNNHSISQSQSYQIQLESWFTLDPLTWKKHVRGGNLWARKSGETTVVPHGYLRRFQRLDPQMVLSTENEAAWTCETCEADA